MNDVLVIFICVVFTALFNVVKKIIKDTSVKGVPDNEENKTDDDWALHYCLFRAEATVKVVKNNSSLVSISVKVGDIYRVVQSELFA